MAKPPKGQDQEGEITVTMIKFGMKGSDVSLQKGLDTIKAAFAQAGFVSVAPEPRLPRANGSKQILGASPDDSDHEVFGDDTIDAEEPTETIPALTSRKAPSQRKAPNYKVIKSL